MLTKNIGIIAAHPDDEVLGCGATIAKLVSEGHQVHILIMAEGITSREGVGQASGQALSALAKAAHASAKVLGAASIDLLHFPDNAMDTLPRLTIVKAVEAFVERHQLEIIYTHHYADVNIDHQITHDAVITACRPLPHALVKTILCFEVVSSSEWQTPDSRACFLPNWFEEVTPFLALKLQALKCYETEMRAWPHPRSYQGVETLAKWRGATIGVEAAEAFVLSRLVQRIMK